MKTILHMILIFGFVVEFNIMAGEPEVSFNGTFLDNPVSAEWQAVSPNFVYTCRYEIGAVSDELRELGNLRFYENEKLLFTWQDNIPGSDLYISNSGYIVFIDLRRHFNHQATLHFYSKTGDHLFTRSFTGASFFQYSPGGNKFGLSADNQITVISLPGGETSHYPNGYQFDISETDLQVAIASQHIIRIYRGTTENVMTTGLALPRKVRVSDRLNVVGVVDKRNLQVYSLNTGKLLFHEKLTGNYSFRDLSIQDGLIYAGIHHRSPEKSEGILRAYTPAGQLTTEKVDREKHLNFPPVIQNQPDEFWRNDSLPWPFMPFDRMPDIWNHYEQHMGGYGAGYSYLHQGLDIITPVGEPTFSVTPGVVKCVLTISGASYWRVAISEEHSPGYSDGWLYAHLIQSSIQVDVGDTVQLHEYLGDIIYWSSNWGHIHFVQIRDTGLVWQYSDNEWGINFNPLLVLRSDPDTIAPVIEDVFPQSKFAFCVNETSQYLDPDSLYGEVDIIVKVNDFCGTSLWTQPAFSLYYTVKSLSSGNTVFPRSLAQVLNHTYPFYAGSNYEPYATLLYKRDDTLLPSSWMDSLRNYHHILTNNNGDSHCRIIGKIAGFCHLQLPGRLVSYHRRGQ